MHCFKKFFGGLVTAAAVTLATSSANAAVVVYDGFDYAVGSDIDTPLNGGTGFTGAWSRAQQGGTPTVFDETGGWPWDGHVTGFPQSPTTGSSFLAGSAADRLTAQRTLSQSAGALAGDDNTLWASVVWHQTGSNFGRHVGFALGNEDLANRSLGVHNNGDAIGVGGAINTLAVTPTIWDNGSVAVRTTAGATNVATNQDNVLVLKYVFADGADLDQVFAYRFTEADILAGNMTESVFNANAISASYAIDQDTFNILSFSQSSRGTSAIDEIRLGDTFLDVAPPITPEPATLGLGLLAIGGLAARRRRA